MMFSLELNRTEQVTECKQLNKYQEFTEQELFIDILSKQFSCIHCQAKMEENLILVV